jgi:hypothetical protein
MAEKQFFTPLSDFVFKLIFGDRRNGAVQEVGYFLDSLCICAVK